MGFNMEHQKEHQKVHLKQCIKQCLKQCLETKFETKLKDNSIFGNMPMLLFFLWLAVTTSVCYIPMLNINKYKFRAYTREVML
jgi:hypothetical protein